MSSGHDLLDKWSSSVGDVSPMTPVLCSCSRRSCCRGSACAWRTYPPTLATTRCHISWAPSLAFTTAQE